MKILLVALNAKYIHSNPAVYSLMTYAKIYSRHMELVEMTINHPEEEVLKEIYIKKADVVAFSCYIWNIGMVSWLITELKKVQPKVVIWLGGPEVSYDAELYLKEHAAADGIVIGEGEQTFLELAGYYIEGEPGLENIIGKAGLESIKEKAGLENIKEKTGLENIKEKTCLENIMGLAFKNTARLNPGSCDPPEKDGTIITTGAREPLLLDRLPFPYENIAGFRNRIIYYESSRGCPFSCSYCLSSIDKRVRFRSIGLVKRELKLFLERGVAQVKFVDRTFNCSRKHAMDIWEFIKENDNGITNFHFEISADLLEDDELELLAALRPGQVQFEIGVQTTNPDTLAAIHRSTDMDKLKRNVRRIKEGKNIHVHLDLIAGLPYEGYASFEKSFREVYSLKPDQLQLGFLKVLKGSRMETESKDYGIICRSTPPYEVLSTDDLTYDEMLTIKGVSEMAEIYYNSGQFPCSIRFLEHYYDNPMQLYRNISEFYENHGIDIIAHSRIKRYEILLDFYEKMVLESEKAENRPEMAELFRELLIYDLFLREDLKSRPSFSPNRQKPDILRRLYTKYQADRSNIHIELFRFDPAASALEGKAIRKETAILFNYGSRNPLSYSAETEELSLSEEGG